MTLAEYNAKCNTDDWNAENNIDTKMKCSICIPISMEDNVRQDQFFNLRFCGKRAGYNFINTVRPKLNGQSGTLIYECPTGFVACSTETSAENTICVEKSKTADCPLTFARFFDAAVATANYSDSAYISFDVKSSAYGMYKFVTSKSKGDNLPLTSFKLEEFKPCLDNRDVSRTSATTFYPLEVDRLNGDCRIVEQFQEKYDKRYTDMGIKIFVKDV